MEWIVLDLDDAPSRPFSTSLSLDSFSVELSGYCRCRHAIFLNLPNHVVNHMLFIPIRGEIPELGFIPTVDGLCELLVHGFELVHALLGSLGDESSLHLRHGCYNRQKQPSYGRSRVNRLSTHVHHVKVNARSVEFVYRVEHV